MAKFFKSLVIFLFGLIIVTSLVSFGSAQSDQNKTISSGIFDLESAVNNGQVVSDGMIEKDQNPDAKPNAIGEGATELGQKIADGFSSFVDMLGQMVFSIFG